MPELPEVETVRRGLAPVLVGQRLTRVESRRKDLRFPLPDRFNERLTGQTIDRLERRAKYLVASLSSGETLVMHLGMTGRFTVAGGTEGRADEIGAYVYGTGADPKHDHIVFHAGNHGRVIYNDPRRFGYMLLVAAGGLEDHALFANLGPEPLGADFNAGYLAERAAPKKVNLKALLMDQRVVAGLGNIYVSEALFRAGLSPLRAAATLAGRGARAAGRSGLLVAAAQDVLTEAILAGGSTLKDYRHADGSSGQYQEAFKVYGREDQGCLRPGCSGTVRRIVQTGRATFYCPRCQT